MNTTDDLRSLLPVIAQLTADQTALWGSMSPQRMTEHLIDSLRGSRGKPALPLVVDERRAAAGRRFLQTDRPMPRNVDNPLMAREQPLQCSSLAEAVTALAGEIGEFYRFFEHDPSATPTHPFFGALAFGEWVRFHHKHFRHHCEQFGLVYTGVEQRQ